MAFLKSTIGLRLVLRTTVRQPKRFFGLTATMSKEQMDELEKNPYFEKYADKIAKMQK